MQCKINLLLNCIIISMMTLCLCACTARSSSIVENNDFYVHIEHTQNKYAKGFEINIVDKDYFEINIDSQDIIIVPAGKEIPEWAKNKKENNDDVVVLQQPVCDIYAAASSVPDIIDSLNMLDNVSYTSTAYEDWSIESMQSALENLSIEYVGKYRAPDYEVLLANGCDLAIESTMIYHSPEVKEKLNQLGIPVMIDTSSYESNPLGRLEWIKVYGAILGVYDDAVSFFDAKEETVEKIKNTNTYEESTPKSVAFFYINSNGSVVVRKPGDYVTKMIEMAGGDYIINSIPEEENALSTMNMQMEAFYAEAIDADILIYNSTIDGEINSLDELIAKSELLNDFKAVKERNVWCSGKNMFQESSAVAEMIEDMYKVINKSEKNEDELTYFHYIGK